MRDHSEELRPLLVRAHADGIVAYPAVAYPARFASKPI